MKRRRLSFLINTSDRQKCSICQRYFSRSIIPKVIRREASKNPISFVRESKLYFTLKVIKKDWTQVINLMKQNSAFIILSQFVNFILSVFMGILSFTQEQSVFHSGKRSSLIVSNSVGHRCTWMYRGESVKIPKRKLEKTRYW